jgi:hypothetical protein
MAYIAHRGFDWPEIAVIGAGTASAAIVWKEHSFKGRACCLFATKKPRETARGLFSLRFLPPTCRMTPIPGRRTVAQTGEFIRMMNYVDDIAATLRRVTANIPFMSDDEKKRLAEYMRKSEPNFVHVLESLEKSPAAR